MAALTLDTFKDDPVVGAYISAIFELMEEGPPDDEASIQATPTLDQLKNDPAVGFYNNAILAIMAAGKNPDGTTWSMNAREPNPTPVGTYQHMTSLASSTALASIPAGATYAVIQVSGANVRWRDDGGTPTATAGMPLLSGGTYQYRGSLSALRFIQESASAVLDVSYYQD